MRLAIALVALLAAAAMTHGCSSEGRDRKLSSFASSTSGASVSASSSGGAPLGGAGGSEDCSDEGACGTETHTFSFDAPNLYFVFDASGSMLELATGKSVSRYKVVRDTAIDLVESLGPLVNVGAALFPPLAAPCSAGKETMPVTPGDAFTKKNGPTLKAFKAATSREPEGGTPTAATLEALLPNLAKLEGRSIMLMLTDGGPNCNAALTCKPEDCMPVIEGLCKPTDGCCDPGFPGAGPLACVDEARTVKALEAIHALGVDVYVIGVADLAAYEDVLDAMAVAGGVPAPGSTKYVQAKNLDDLGSIFAAIAASAIPCEIKLTEPPVDKGLTNVYLGCKAIPFDAVNGWSWQGDDLILLHGDACAKLKSGKVDEMKVITGCPSELPK
ncbi:MAG: VWA domain-containing protein [Deltaproteobacteria bacterium]|nr:VWA domain-containing protein [Deltaproteobacteria bacterium]